MFGSLPRSTPPISRREWLRLGGLSLGALTTGLDPASRLLFATEERTPSTNNDFSVILFWANGGPSHIDLFDLKPNAPAEYAGPFRPISTNVPGIEITECLPRVAQCADKFTLLRSLHHQRAEHSGGTHRFLTGYSSRQANLQDAEHPELGAIVAEQLGDPSQGIPPFIANTKLYGSGPGYLGPGFAPYMPTPNPLTSTGNNTYDPVPLYTTGDAATDALAITSQGVLTLNRRTSLLRELDTLPRWVDATASATAVDRFQQQAFGMLASRKTQEAFNLSRETIETRQRYGDSHWGKSLLTCRRLVEAGVRFVQCQATFRLKPETGRTCNWDDHSVNSDIFTAYREKLPSLDQSMSALIEDLFARGLDQRVLFIFCGEFGRTPRIAYQDKSRRPGRDHWPRAMSVLLAGGGLKMGQVIGATNSKAEEPVVRPMDSNCLLATIYHRFGIDYHQSYLDNAGRPLPILPSGEPIAELL
ncbi:DUF1501 domain-containing protein [bacterium]|nr:DUF1501 domain-containing protein [bacterium]